MRERWWGEGGGNAATFIRRDTMTGSCPAGFTGSSGVGQFDLIVRIKERLPPGSASDS